MKDRLLRLLRSAGAFELTARTPWRRRRLAILMYHGVSISDEHRWDSRLYMSPQKLRDSLDLVRRTECTVLPLGEAVDRLSRGALPPRAVSLTFDDGNADFARRAAPILSEYAMPATVFVSTYYCRVQKPVFNPTCRYLLWKGRGGTVDPTGLAEGDAPLRTDKRDERWAAFRRIAAFARGQRLSGAAKDELLDELAARLKVDVAGLRASRMFYLMNEQELLEIPADLVDVQLHTHRHRTPQDRELFLREIRDNRAYLRDVLGDRPFSHFCYPSGNYTTVFLTWLAEVGVDIATTTDVGLASASHDPLLLPRVGLTSGVSELELEAWLTGLRDLLPVRRRNRSQL